MSFTYTYTARSTEDSSKAVTFTIIDDKLKIDLTGLYDQVSEMSKEEERKDVLKDILSTQSKFVILKTMEKLSEPVHLTDIKPSYDDEDFTLTFWKRVGGLRLAPIVILMGEVDNPEAAQAFIATLEERKSQIGKPGIFSGPLYYWFTWAALAISALILIRWPHKKEQQE
jgi:hypothetical protein